MARRIRYRRCVVARVRSMLPTRARCAIGRVTGSERATNATSRPTPATLTTSLSRNPKIGSGKFGEDRPMEKSGDGSQKGRTRLQKKTTPATHSHALMAGERRPSNMYSECLIVNSCTLALRNGFSHTCSPAFNCALL